MAQRVKHLLEAFQKTGALQAGNRPSVEASQPLVRPSPGRSTVALSQPVVLSLVALAALVLGIFIGRYSAPAAAEAASGGTIERPVSGVAAQPPQPAPVQAPAPANAGAAQGDVGAALLERANKFSLLAVTYGKSPANQLLAQQTADFLRAAGFPAAAPIARGNKLHVLVGAAPTRAQLYELQNRLRAATNASGKSGDFSTAYAVEIDTYVQR